MAKLNLKTPEISEKHFDVFLMILGAAIIGIVIYIGAKNGPGKVIDASDRFGKQNGESKSDDTGAGDTIK